jgi:serine/threonine-protein kinase RIM15
VRAKVCCHPTSYSSPLRDCDRQLQRVSSSIQTYFEQKLKESEVEREVEREQRAYERESERERGRLHGETPSYSPDLWSEPDLFQSGGDLKSMLQSDDNSSEGVPDYEPERTGRHSRQRKSHHLLPDAVR